MEEDALFYKTNIRFYIGASIENFSGLVIENIFSVSVIFVSYTIDKVVLRGKPAVKIWL
jgi:hypothetical protein